MAARKKGCACHERAATGRPYIKTPYSGRIVMRPYNRKGDPS